MLAQPGTIRYCCAMELMDYIKRESGGLHGDDAVDRLSATIGTAIKDGVLDEDDPLPTEREFCEELDLPRSVVREALERLRTTGYITRVAGLGTFVSPNYIRRNLGSVYNFTQEVRRHGMEPTTQVLSFQKTTPAGYSARTLDFMGDDHSIYRVGRLRMADGVATALEIEHLPCDRFDGLGPEDLTGSLYDLLSERWGVEVADADEYYQAILLGKQEAKALGRQHRSAAFRVVRVARDGEGRVFNVTEAFIPGDHTRLGVKLRGRMGAEGLTSMPAFDEERTR